jgi:hypothetical protein
MRRRRKMRNPAPYRSAVWSGRWPRKSLW